MTTIQIDLAKNPDVAALIGDMEPGDKVYGSFSIKSQDSQTATLRIEQFADDPDDLDAEDDDSEDNAEGESEGEEDDKAEATKSPEGSEAEAKPVQKPGSLGRELAAKMMTGESSF